MVIFLVPILDLGFYYRKSRPNRLKNAWPSADSSSDHICTKKFQQKPHFKGSYVRL